MSKKYNRFGHISAMEVAFNDILKDEFASIECMNILRYSVDRQMLFIPDVEIIDLKEVENISKIIPLSSRNYKNGNDKLSKYQNECTILNQDYRKSLTITIVDKNDNFWVKCISKKAFFFYKKSSVVFNEMTDVEFWCKKEEIMPINIDYWSLKQKNIDELLKCELYIILNFINKEENANRN